MQRGGPQGPAGRMNGRTASVDEESVASFYWCEKGLKYVQELVCGRGSCRIYLTEGDGSAPDSHFKVSAPRDSPLFQRLEACC